MRSQVLTFKLSVPRPMSWLSGWNMQRNASRRRLRRLYSESGLTVVLALELPMTDSAACSTFRFTSPLEVLASFSPLEHITSTISGSSYLPACLPVLPTRFTVTPFLTRGYSSRTENSYHNCYPAVPRAARLLPPRDCLLCVAYPLIGLSSQRSLPGLDTGFRAINLGLQYHRSECPSDSVQLCPMWEDPTRPGLAEEVADMNLTSVGVLI